MVNNNYTGQKSDSSMYQKATTIIKTRYGGVQIKKKEKEYTPLRLER